MRKQAPKLSAKQAAVGYLSRRDHAEKELRQKLIMRGYSEPDVSEAIAFCQDYNWLDDARYAVMIMKNGIAKGWGWLRIEQEMHIKGIHHAIVSQTADECEIDWYELACEVAQRKFGASEMDTPKEKARRFRFMQSRGFDFDQIKSALNIEDEY
ncbi:recombination regulator RecX [Photobacterium sp. SDRW27]|uniref:recombination regulator RecX n=1 Tax=Photobacterium obscurum TaxID=2829490 RepID=UPI002242EEE6|nr:recombination regulator RecX [Photobacterium obscurum]MCW8330613.1 recombination regulator RecX [Photobacterium obscurum]